MANATVVNKINSATDHNEARRMATQMFKGMTFFAGGKMRIIGDHRVKVLSPLFADGLGVLWSAAYTAVEVEHNVSNAGFHTEVTMYTNSLVGGAPAGAFAADQAAIPGDAPAPQVTLKKTQGGVSVQGDN
jgi:hypothetical protein